MVRQAEAASGRKQIAVGDAARVLRRRELFDKEQPAFSRALHEVKAKQCNLYSVRKRGAAEDELRQRKRNELGWQIRTPCGSLPVNRCKAQCQSCSVFESMLELHTHEVAQQLHGHERRACSTISLQPERNAKMVFCPQVDYCICNWQRMHACMP